MAREDKPSPAGLAHHYSHVLVAMNETRKGSPDTEATTALDKSIKGLCELIDVLVAKEHREQATTTRNDA